MPLHLQTVGVEESLVDQTDPYRRLEAIDRSAAVGEPAVDGSPDSG
jgi:hypothetical protein